MKQIIAMGGGGFSMEPNSLLDIYILQQAKSERPKVCFLPTASGDAEGYIAKFYHSFKTLNCIPTHLSLFKLPTKDLRSFVLEQDVIYVGGGNTFNLLALWKTWGLDEILREAWEQGVVLAGLSAGSLCWYEEGVTDICENEMAMIHGLGFVKGSHFPHYDSEPGMREYYHKLMMSGDIQPGYALDDGTAIHYIGTDIHRVISSRPDARACYVSSSNGKITEKELPVTYLG